MRNKRKRLAKTRTSVKARTHPPDYIFLGIICLFVVVGFVNLFSASALYGQERFSDVYFFIKRQIILGLIPGIIAGYVLYSFPLNFLKKVSTIFFVFFLFMTILVFLPVVGVSVGGASRWVAVGPVQFQPSEFLKIGYILYVAALLCKIPFEGAGSFGRTISKALRGLRGTNLKNFAGGQIFSLRKREKQKMQGSKERGAFFPFIMVSGATAFLLVLQPDIGTLGLILGVGIILYFISGASFFHITFLGGILAALGAALAYTTPYRVERLMVFLNPKIDPLGIGYHINQILIAIGSGGISGLGLGMSQQKFGFIPQPIGDSIFAIFAEEFGFIGSIFFITLLLIFLWRGFSIARHAPSSFAYLACVGIISWIGIQAFINIGAMVGLIPLTGIPLPFFSYGGSAMMAILMGMGIVLNISRHTV